MGYGIDVVLGVMIPHRTLNLESPVVKLKLSL